MLEKNPFLISINRLYDYYPHHIHPSLQPLPKDIPRFHIDFGRIHTQFSVPRFVLHETLPQPSPIKVLNAFSSRIFLFKNESVSLSHDTLNRRASSLGDMRISTTLESNKTNFTFACTPLPLHALQLFRKSQRSHSVISMVIRLPDPEQRV